MSLANGLNTGSVAPQLTTQFIGTTGGGGVGTLNGLNGNINLLGAGGITITPNAGPPATITITGGGGPGLFLPLAGGTMDPLPNGIINAHTLNDVITIEGTAAGSGLDTTIITNSGNDLLLQTDPADGILADTGALIVNAINQIQLNGTTTIQPAPGYTYPNNPERGLTIRNWQHPAGGQQIGCEIDNITSATGEADGLIISRVKAGGGSDALGIKVDDVGDAISGANIAKGMNIASINSGGISHGINISGVAGPTRSYAVQAQNIGSATGNAVGYEVDNMNADLDARGVLVSNLTTTNNDAYGMEIQNITGGDVAYGIRMDNLSAVGTDAYGIEAVNIASANTTFGMKMDTLSGRAVNGIDIANMNASSTDANGIQVRGLTAAGIAAGLYMDNFNAGSDLYALDLNNLTGTTSARGINLVLLNATSGDTTGLEMNTLNASQNARGIYIDNIASSAQDAWGAELNNINGDNVRGCAVAGVNATSRGRGFDATSISGGGEAIGYSADGINATVGSAYGYKADGITSDSALGAEFQNITANAGFAFGVNTQTLNSAVADSVAYRARDINAQSIARGVELADITGQARGFGIEAQNITGVGSVGIGCSFQNIKSISTDAYGGFFRQIGDPGVGNRAVGIDIADVFQDSSVPSSEAVGAFIGNVDGATATGIEMKNITTATGTAMGIDIDTVSGRRANGISVVGVQSTTAIANGIRVVNTSTTTAGVPAYGINLARGIKAIGAAGQLAKIADGNLGLSVQVADAGNPNINSDGGNFVIIDATAPVGINLVAPVGGFENGHWFLITKIGGGGHNIQDTNLADAFNAQVAGAPFAFGGPAFGMVLMFFNAGIWYAHVF